MQKKCLSSHKDKYIFQHANSTKKNLLLLSIKIQSQFPERHHLRQDEVGLHEKCPAFTTVLPRHCNHKSYIASRQWPIKCKLFMCVGWA